MDATKRAAKERRDLRMNHPHKNIFPDEFNGLLKKTPEIFVQ